MDQATQRSPSSLVSRLHVYGISSNSPHSAFGGVKQSGIGRETHKMMLDQYQSTKNLLVS
ncbi:aldehyde dehydrogenase family protein [Streptomyces sp. NPDC056169]|uniref:aldehyde dehydrogenase family protein n=1 Tax=Streptomyces sp. NPDC056169 TaxID=3345734 RepID=UPI0035DF2ABE